MKGNFMRETRADFEKFLEKHKLSNRVMRTGVDSGTGGFVYFYPWGKVINLDGKFKIIIERDTNEVKQEIAVQEVKPLVKATKAQKNKVSDVVNEEISLDIKPSVKLYSFTTVKPVHIKMAIWKYSGDRVFVNDALGEGVNLFNLFGEIAYRVSKVGKRDTVSLNAFREVEGLKTYLPEDIWNELVEPRKDLINKQLKVMWGKYGYKR